MYDCNVIYRYIYIYELPSLLLPFSLVFSSHFPPSFSSLLPSPFFPSLPLFTESEELLSQLRSAHIVISPDLTYLVATTQDNHLLVNLLDYFQVTEVHEGGG